MEITLDEKICAWKRMEQNKDSTTFIEARHNPNSKLYSCVKCDGKNNSCQYYITEK